ncbi:hypothetical protein H072_10153 [Dactylellina haptotyla CBS 200.50]|uniref:Glucose receptor Git3-like N-terminal domain-containing protein n=1 Tax=Dactylellina haptotyla (strain CBS 200.50) TaxID=1284197 RepID=S8BME0_DACHA|nr:hypothetical protein H072_10153 [Dactylellina haptotyla CBS 200.50]
MFTPLAWTIAVLSLIGSLSSFFGSGFIVITYLVLPIKRHFRHSLILNLAIADFINSTNNATSGLWRLINRREIPDSPGCIANGFIGQLSVQATDTSILAIAIVTVWSLTRKTMIRETLPRTTTFIICGATWILPITTACVVLGMNRYGPVSGNWCWIKAEPSYFRYVMTHGWRFAFIFSEIIMYTYLHFYIRKRFGGVLDASQCNSNVAKSTVHDVGSEMAYGSNAPPHNSQQARTAPDVEAADSFTRTEVWVSETYDDKGPAHEVRTTISSSSSGTAESPAENQRPESVHTATSKRPRFNNPFAHRRGDDKNLGDQDSTEDPNKRLKQANATRSKRVRRILLLNAYPAMYILLWIPGIINRLIEASGHRSPVMQVMQASTQFVGLANAITYGWNERVGRQLRDYISEKWSSRGTRSVKELPREKIELKSNLNLKVKLQGSKERLREIREGLKKGEDELPEDQGHLMYVNGKWEWTRSTSFHSHDGDADADDDRELQQPQSEPRRE